MSVDDSKLVADMLNVVFDAMRDRTKEALSRYGSPLDGLIEKAVTRHEAKFQSLMDDAITKAFDGDFREQLADAASRKLAKVLISKLEGEIEKKANDLRSDPAFRARLTVAIDNAVKQAGKGGEA
jgi:hypothetical protein